MRLSYLITHCMSSLYVISVCHLCIFQTHKVYSWTQPQVCLVHHAASVTLPADSSPKPCPPCNAGMMSVNGSCVFCSPGTFSPDGRGPCQSCPASTAPKAGINIQWWNSLPENANITTSCLSSDGKCSRSCEFD